MHLSSSAHAAVSLRMDQEFYRRQGLADMKDENGTSKSMSAAARRSFFRRRVKHKRSGSKDGKDLMALDTISTDSLPIPDGENFFFFLIQPHC